MFAFVFLLPLLTLLCQTVRAQSVFAHVIVGNNGAYTASNWESDIKLAASKGIDAFALNIAPPLAGTTSTQVDLAFQAAAAAGTGFQLFFSFDYMGSGQPWSTADILTLLRKYGTSDSYFKHQGKPFISTFEGPSNSDVTQWTTIRNSIPSGIYFVPDWTSQGPGWNADLYDGAFSWDMWPDGPHDMTAAPDRQWQAALRPARKSYMMGISPWFYTDLPAYGKAWVWRGDGLWWDRWQQALEIKPDFIEIVTWNDYGESHYIGPIHQPGIPQSTNADARPYVEGYSHEAWLETLPYQIAAYKHAANPAHHAPPSVKAGDEKVVYWYRNTPASAGSTQATGNNCPSPINTFGYQTCYPVTEVLEDAIFALALLHKPGSISIVVGDGAPVKFRGLKAGINFVSRRFRGETGAVKVRSSFGVRGQGRSITAQPVGAVANFNAWVGCAGGYER